MKFEYKVTRITNNDAKKSYKIADLIKELEDYDDNTKIKFKPIIIDDVEYPVNKLIFSTEGDKLIIEIDHKKPVKDSKVVEAVNNGPKKGKIKAKIKVSHNGKEDTIETVDKQDLVINIKKALSEDLKDVIAKAYNISPKKVKIVSTGKYVSDSNDEEYYDLEMDLDPEHTYDSIKAPINMIKDNSIILDAIKDSFKVGGFGLRVGEDLVTRIPKEFTGNIDTKVCLYITKAGLRYRFYIALTTGFKKLAEQLIDITDSDPYGVNNDFIDKLDKLPKADYSKVSAEKYNITGELQELTCMSFNYEVNLKEAKNIFNRLCQYIEAEYYSTEPEPVEKEDLGINRVNIIKSVIEPLLINRERINEYTDYGAVEHFSPTTQCDTELTRLYNSAISNPYAFDQMKDMIINKIDQAEQKAINLYKKYGFEYGGKETAYFKKIRRVINGVEGKKNNLYNKKDPGFSYKVTDLADELLRILYDFYFSSIDEKTINNVQNTSYYKKEEYHAPESDPDFLSRVNKKEDD